ncbi:unnamed protein product [Periconia digitata]|uniref:Zn(2)-C6 fungal-type domain-containing protein n=1 Tax=Periconia digitata TaxID=1303443 RepID=A0A9W4U3G8_9PLEO|nr:unnamed protein product [Periconia digitata]
MAGTMPISSPSHFLGSAVASPVSANPPKKPAQKKKETRQPVEAAGTKRKQSKSRNGCVTCKAKRLKCDETKPTCQQCARRTVACGGYKKDFKWRPFVETTFATAGKPPAKATKAAPPPSFVTTAPSASLPAAHEPVFHFQAQAQPQPQIQRHFQQTQPHHSFDSLQDAHYRPVRSQLSVHPLSPVSNNVAPVPRPITSMYPNTPTSPYLLVPAPTSPVEKVISGSIGSSSSAFESESVGTHHTTITTSSSVSPGQSPRLVDLLIPGTDLSVPPEEYSLFREQHESFYQPTGLTPPANTTGDDEDIEEVPRIAFSDWKLSSMRLGSQTPSDSSSTRSDSPKIPLYKTPQPTSTEMLTRHFDRETCGILSVKDGPTENPWRTLIWPLARECSALYHAIVSMTSFHQSRDTPALRIQGIDHMRNAVHALGAGLENMRVDAAISTTLVLAFSESWDQHISTGINHIKGAKMLIDKALVQHSKRRMCGEELSRLQFLCNTWTYMDVIARLTSTDGDESSDYDSVFDSFNMGCQSDAQLDPLMGCASTLFPLIGRVANIVRRVRQTHGSYNSPAIISQAMELKKQLETWMPPSYIEDPEDETTSPHDSIKTAFAYQYATLLYLHQAICREIATISPTSRSTIVHIFPLMAAGCEVVSKSDRQWVRERWEMMAQRMKIGIIEKCIDVTREVWARRDAFNAGDSIFESDDTGNNPPSPSLKRNSSSISSDDFDTETDGNLGWLENSSKRRASGLSARGEYATNLIKSEMSSRHFRSDTIGTEDLLVEFTVKGRLHWLGVMTDWNWEVLLG